MPAHFTLDPKSKTYIQHLQFGGELKKHRQNILRAEQKHGARCVDELEKVITTGTRSGRTYTYKGNKYVASAPGEPPANRSGRLASSFGFHRTIKELHIYNKAKSDDGAPYPWYLEEGTSRMKPRFYFLTTIKKLGLEFKKELEKIAKE